MGIGREPVRENYQCILLLSIVASFSPCPPRVSERYIELNILSASLMSKNFSTYKDLIYYSFKVPGSL